MRRFLIALTILVGAFFGTHSLTEEANPYNLTNSQFVERYFAVPHMATAKEEYCLTQAIYYEAANQSPIGKEAVALVVLNRVGAKGYPNTICGVIRQASIVDDRKICQFSFWCEIRKKPMKDMWAEAQQIAHRVLQNYWDRDILATYQTAMYFHADYVRPHWRHTKKFLGKIDNHLFYGERDVVGYH